MLKRIVDGVIRGRGSLPKDASTLVFEDDVALNGGWYVWKAILDALKHCLMEANEKTGNLVVLALGVEAFQLSQSLGCGSYTTVLLDGYTDPEGWLKKMKTPASSQIVNLTSLNQLLESFNEAMTSTGVVLIDNVSSLLFRHPQASVRCTADYTSGQIASQVLNLLQKLKMHQNCKALILRHYLSGSNADAVEAVRSLCSARLQLTTVHKLLIPFSETAPHGAVTSYQTTETGRWISQVEWYSVDRFGQIKLFPPPNITDMTSARLVEAIMQKSSTPNDQQQNKIEQTLMSQMEGGMKLTLTEEEKAAKEAVVLPYEKAGETTQLGEIHYVRDSEEDYDSDEDPDEDLDI